MHALKGHEMLIYDNFRRISKSETNTPPTLSVGDLGCLQSIAAMKTMAIVIKGSEISPYFNIPT